MSITRAIYQCEVRILEVVLLADQEDDSLDTFSCFKVILAGLRHGLWFECYWDRFLRVAPRA